MSRNLVFFQSCSLFALASTALAGELAQDVRASLDRITGGKGTYASDHETYSVVLPRYEATIVYNWQTLSPNLGLNSWAAFKAGINGQATLTGQVLLLEDEVDPVITAALDAGLKITGLASSTVFDGPRLYALDLNGTGTFQGLAEAFRRCLDETIEVRRANNHPRTAAPTAPLESSIDSAPLDAALSIKGDVVDGTYRATVGANALPGRTQVRPEMGMSTWISLAGTNERAIAHGEFIATSDDLQSVLKALRAKGMSIISIRNHTIGELPQCVFVYFRGEGPAIELAKAIKFALDVWMGKE